MVERLRYLRKRAGLTQQELGEKCGAGCRWVQKLEAGELSITHVTLEKAVALSRALGISERELLAIGEVEDLYSDPVLKLKILQMFGFFVEKGVDDSNVCGIIGDVPKIWNAKKQTLP